MYVINSIFVQMTHISVTLPCRKRQKEHSKFVVIHPNNEGSVAD